MHLSLLCRFLNRCISYRNSDERNMAHMILNLLHAVPAKPEQRCDDFDLTWLMRRTSNLWPCSKHCLIANGRDWGKSYKD